MPASGAAPTKFLPETNIFVGGVSAAPPDSGQASRRKFAAVIAHMPEKRLADIADVTLEAVRGWKRGGHLPSALPLFRLAREFPFVWEFVAEMSGRRSAGPAEHESPKLNSLFGAMQRLAGSTSPEGAVARAILLELGGTHPDPMQTAVVRDLFEARKR